jgi:hypothetical protein
MRACRVIPSQHRLVSVGRRSEYIHGEGAGLSDAEVQMASERAFICGNSKYFVVEHHGTFIVQRQNWLGRTFIAYAHNLAEAIACIEADAHCWQIRAA